jgi:hypothetical protein
MSNHSAYVELTDYNEICLDGYFSLSDLKAIVAAMECPE